MTLRKYALLSLALLAILPGCEKSFVSDDEIAFSPLNQKATKAIMTGTAYTDNGFVVHAWRNGELYFQDAEVKEIDGTWASRNFTCYWPIDGRLDFTAYSPSSAGIKGVTVRGNGQVGSDSYSIKTADDMGLDLCYASLADCTRQYNDPVDLVFHHALSFINVNLSIQGDYTNGSQDGLHNEVSVEVTGVKLLNVMSTGTFNTGAASHWSSQKEPMDYEITAPDDPERSVAFLMIPQTLQADATIQVNYKITQTVYDGSTEIRTIQTEHEGLAVIGTDRPAWKENTKVTYNISIGPLHPIEFEAVYAQDWEIRTGDPYIF